MKTVQYALSVAILIAAVGYFAYRQLVWFADPSLTQMELSLATWQGLLPAVFLGVILATVWLIDHWRNRND